MLSQGRKTSDRHRTPSTFEALMFAGDTFAVQEAGVRRPGADYVVTCGRSVRYAEPDAHRPAGVTAQRQSERTLRPAVSASHPPL